MHSQETSPEPLWKQVSLKATSWSSEEKSPQEPRIREQRGLAGKAAGARRSYQAVYTEGSLMRNAGVRLLVAAYALLIYISLSSIPYSRAHPHLDPVMLAAYAAPWPVALGCTVAVAGIMLAVVPIRRGERWALWTSLAMFVVLFVTRVMTDPRCLVVLDPHQHGCHSFMIAIVLGIAGLLLARK